MITKEQFLEKCEKLFPEYDFSNIDWKSYTTSIIVTCRDHGNFEILPSKLYQQRGRCKKCRAKIMSEKNSANANSRLKKARQTNLEKYRAENPFQSEEIKQKIRKTSMERYGGIGLASKEISEKIVKTKEEKYGDSTFTNREKCMQTVQDRYGVDNVYASKEVLEKKKQTYLDHYGVDNPLKAKEVREKAKKTKEKRYGSKNYNNINRAKQTNLKKYNVETPFQILEIREKCIQNLHTPEADEKRRQTCLLNFGVEYSIQLPNVQEKAKINSHTVKALQKQKQTNIQKYGVACAFQRADVIEKTHSEEVKLKRRKTLHEHGTYGKSDAEDRCYDLLVTKYQDAIHHYTSELYPFECDMYVPSLDLYIECNFFWTHNDHFFESNNPDDINTLNNWTNKNTKFYNNAINVWTNSDIKKRDMAIKNNLNYLVFWTEQEFIDWINT